MNSIKDNFALLDEFFSWDPFHRRVFVVNRDSSTQKISHATLRLNDKVVELDNASIEDILKAWKDLHKKPTYAELEKELNTLKASMKEQHKNNN